MRGQEHTLRTPKDRVIKIKMWGTLPYITKDELQRIIDDLPEADAEGRNGELIAKSTVARVCRNACTHAQVRDQLSHLRDDMNPKKLNNVCSKYRQLPESYYGGDSSKFVTPDTINLDELSGDSPSEMWEWYSGSASLSDHLREFKVTHLPPLDYRYGWNLSKRQHQMKALDALLTVGTKCLVASPNCAPWGNNSRSSPQDVRCAKREEEYSTLAFLAVACFFQFLLNRRYILENCAYSDIFTDSPLHFLRLLPYFLALLDQCTCGGQLEGFFIRKRSHFQSSHVMHHIQSLCGGGHTHLNLRGSGRAAA